MKGHCTLQLVRGLGLALVALVALFAAQDQASACSCYCDEYCHMLGDCCSWCAGGAAVSSGPAEISVSPLGAHGARIKVSGLQTMAMSGGFDCSAALGNISGIQRVNSVTLVNARTGRPIYKFGREELAAQSFDELATDLGRGGANTKWLGFHTRKERAVAGEIPSQFVIDVTLKRGVSFLKFANDLRDRGMLGGGSAHADGSLDLHHFFLRDLKAFDFLITVPSTPPNG